MNVLGARKEAVALLSYKVNGSAAITDTGLLRTRGVCSATFASLLLSMVLDSSATVVSGASRIPFGSSSRNRRLPWRCCSSTMVERSPCSRKREDEVFPNAARIDIGPSSHWVAVPRHLAEAAGEEPVREVGAMTVAQRVGPLAVEAEGGHGRRGIHGRVLDPGV